MAQITEHPTITLEASFKVTEAELRALDALAGYGDDAFIKMFYTDLGEHYMKPHEAVPQIYSQYRPWGYPPYRQSKSRLQGSSVVINLKSPSETGRIRDIFQSYGFPKWTHALNGDGDYPVFLAQVVLVALELKLSRKEPFVSSLNIEVDRPEVAMEYYQSAKSAPLILETVAYEVRANEMEGIRVAHLVVKETGMAIPFYVLG